MSDSSLLKADHEQPYLDPSISQLRAADPTRHVWVRASAGSGKTKVLVDRLLRLLLPDPVTKAAGIKPDKILCLTFTKAGAAEMSLRLQKQLLEWSAAEDNKLRAALTDLNGIEPDADMLRSARRLFASLLDAPARLRILTIHAFCQSVLGKFPVETGLSPDFTVIEDSDQSEFLQQSLHEILELATRAPNSDIGECFARLAVSKNMEQLKDELKPLMGEPIKLAEILGGHDTLEKIRNNLAAQFGLTQIDDITFENFCLERNIPRSSLVTLADHLKGGSESNHKHADTILTWLSADITERFETLDTYIKSILRKPLGNAALANTDLMSRRQKEIERIDVCYLADNIRATADLLYLARAVLSAYERRKKHFGVMDYNDLIFYTRRLLSGEIYGDDTARRDTSNAWVLYKLDEGIDHILVDESQDTNPDQWKIVEQLSTEYFSGAGRPVDRPRTLFVVGDEKQSIFSFQRADPAEFHRMREFFAQKSSPIQDGFEESLVYSFRTTAPVLELTDATFDDPALRHHIGIKNNAPLRHISFRTTNKKEMTGSVELWEPVSAPDKPPVTFEWKLPINDESDSKSIDQILASRIALNIRAMIDRGDAQAGDIMILMRSRSPLMLHIIREIKRQGLPVSGLDRMVLRDSLAVQDLLAACEFALLNDDSFVLAVLLKSPFIGLDDGALLAITKTRAEKQTLWSALRDLPQYKETCDWLHSLTARASRTQPYEFLESVLTLPCPADPQGSGYRAIMKRLSADALEPLDEMISQALKLELQDIRTLQDFVAFQKNTVKDIKREMEEAGSQIRIMTVHASKGLEAPIVILPDTMSVPMAQSTDAFLWPDKSGLPAPLWAQGKEQRSALYAKGLETVQALNFEEYSRLLYVAMTRAKDRLIVCGAKSRESKKHRNWYQLIEAGFTRLKNVQRLDNGTKIYKLGDTPRVAAAQKEVQPAPLPEWLTKSLPDEQIAAGTFAPSKQEIDDQPALSPSDQTMAKRFRRGLATHKLLEILPELPQARREQAARSYVGRPALDLSTELQESIVTETMKVLNDPVFAPVFGQNSLAEVPVTGQIADGRVINGQIDRLVITDTEILIVDYKTNRPSPRDIGDIPAAYKAQLKAYSIALSLIYPDHAVRCALLWTDQPLLMPLDV